MEDNNSYNPSTANTGNGFNNGGNGFNNSGAQNQFNNNYNRLPADSSALTLGIISTVLAVLSCCTGITGIIGIILAAIGLNKANSSLKIYNADPEKYNYSTYKNVNNAKTWSLIGLIFSIVITVFWIIYISIVGFAIFDQIKNGTFNTSDDYEYTDDYDNNTYESDQYKYDESQDGVYDYNEEKDSLDSQVVPDTTIEQ